MIEWLRPLSYDALYDNYDALELTTPLQHSGSNKLSCAQIHGFFHSGGLSKKIHCIV